MIWLILGDIASDLACEEPKTSGVFGKFLFGFKAVTNVDGLVETCRRAAHTRHWGKTSEQARDEFNERVTELYEANGESVPVPHEQSMVESETEREGIASPDSGSDSSNSYFSAQSQPDEPRAAKGDGLIDPAPQKEGHRLERESMTAWPSGSVPTASRDNLRHDKSNSLTLGGSDRLGSKATSGVIKVAAGPNILSKEWWTPTRGLGVAAATSAGVALLAGGIYLFNKYFRIRRKTGRGKRIHARSWNIENLVST